MAAMRLSVAELRAAASSHGQEFEALVILRKCSTRTARNENTYLAVEMGDRTGSFSANVFSDNALSDFFRGAAEGSILHVAGRIDFYQGRFSPKLSQARVLEEADLADLGGIDALVESAPESLDSLQEEFQGLVAKIQHPELRRTVEMAFESVADRFPTAPAAMAMHHAYRSGLIEHTVHVGRVCVALLPLYSEVPADLALAGALLHDIGKALEYEGGLAPRKARTGQLQGHVVLGYRMVRKAGLQARLDADTLERLEHIILSHQGELEWGAAVMAATPEAVFVSMIDNIDAKMGMVQRALRHGDDAEFSEYLPGLKSPLLRSASPGAAGVGPDDELPEAQGSLPLE